MIDLEKLRKLAQEAKGSDWPFSEAAFRRAVTPEMMLELLAMLTPAAAPFAWFSTRENADWSSFTFSVPQDDPTAFPLYLHPPAQQGWIATADQLPPLGEDVLAIYKGRYGIGRRFALCDKPGQSGWSINGGVAGAEGLKFKYWQPLPALPK